MNAEFVRVGVQGYGPITRAGSDTDLEKWLRNKKAYWARMDQMMADLKFYGVQIVPMFLWRTEQFAALTPNDKVIDFFTDENSASFQLYARYVTEFIERYRDSGIIAFYELGCEQSLAADWDMVRRCKDEHNDDRCDLISNYTTDDLRKYLSHASQLVRTLHPGKLISSGMATPRANAEHMRRQPEWLRNTIDWRADSAEDLAKNFKDVNESVDLMSLHLYEEPGRGDAIALLKFFNDVATSIGKQLYIGEYGDAHPTVSVLPSAPFSHRVLHAVQDFSVAYSSPWGFEYYWESPHRESIQRLGKPVRSDQA